SDSYDSDGVIVSYSWDFGDGSNSTGVSANHSYADDGVYTVTLTLTDDDGATSTATASKTILNRSPTASFTESATTVYTDEMIYFNATASYDPDGSIVSYFWDFGDGANASGVTVAHAFSDDGVYTVTLTVTDNDGSADTATSTKTILNRSPVAVFTESTETAYVGEPITFNASGSYDLDGYIATYFWDFGDGSNGTGTVLEHTYSTNQTYTVTLTVTDDDGTSDSALSTKTILQNESPVALFTESAETVLTGETIYFNASASYDPDGSIVSYFWDFGDGANATGVLANYSYVDNGVYTVTLTVTDDRGATSTNNATKTIQNRPPVALFTESASMVYTGESIAFNGSDSYDSDGTIATYFWDFGDGTNATSMIVVHSYGDDGTYIVTLMVTDDDGATASANATKTVLNRPPVAVFTESTETAYTDENIMFNATSSYDSDGAIITYFWDFGDGTNTTGITVQHSYAEDGNYTVTLTVTDDDGATAAI
ncbi:MAG: PKD domain-containing protein, partial [Gammaproteobacteria bacterium]|nr:PKD domain-containing protein [Gammaproteobacteria bacterium]